jgi:hypothetical protein
MRTPPDVSGNATPGKILINGKERFFLLKSELEEILGKWPKEVDRMLHASRHGTPWLTIVSNQTGKSGAEVRVTTESVLRAAHRLAAGERPPLMPSERRKSSPVPQGTAPGGVPDAVISAFLRAGEMLPPGVKSVDFQQERNMIFIHWENGDFQSIRKISHRGRSTRAITVCFSAPANAPKPIVKSSRPHGGLEVGED